MLRQRIYQIVLATRTPTMQTDCVTIRPAGSWPGSPARPGLEFAGYPQPVGEDARRVKPNTLTSENVCSPAALFLVKTKDLGSLDRLANCRQFAGIPAL